MADIPNHVKKPRKNVGFRPLPETLKPSHRRGHRVHLQKSEFDGELLPDHPSAIKTRGAKGFYHACNGGVDYHRTMPYVSDNMNDSKADLRSRSESPRRARAARERYWSYRVIQPDSQRNRLHLDFDAQKDREGNNYPWYRLSLLPSEAPLVTPSKRELFKEAQGWPRPPRTHYAVYYRRKGSDSVRRVEEQQLIGASDGWTLSRTGVPKKTWPQGPTPGDGYTSLNEARYLESIIDLEEYEDAVDAELNHPDWHRRSWVGPAIDEHTYEEEDEGVGALFKNESDVNALFEVAEQKYALTLAKKRKKLQKQGWDVWEAEDVMSPRTEADWTEVDGELEDWELEAAV